MSMGVLDCCLLLMADKYGNMTLLLFLCLLVIGCGVGFCVQWVLFLVVVLMVLVVELVFCFLSLWGAVLMGVLCKHVVRVVWHCFVFG